MGYLIALWAGFVFFLWLLIRGINGIIEEMKGGEHMLTRKYYNLIASIIARVNPSSSSRYRLGPTVRQDTLGQAYAHVQGSKEIIADSYMAACADIAGIMGYEFHVDNDKFQPDRWAKACGVAGHVDE